MHARIQVDGPELNALCLICCFMVFSDSSDAISALYESIAKSGASGSVGLRRIEKQSSHWPIGWIVDTWLPAGESRRVSTA